MARKNRDDIFFVGCANFFKGIPRVITFKNLWFWLFLFHTLLLLAASIEIALFQKSVLFKGLLVVMDMPWVFGLILATADNPNGGAEIGLFINFLLFGFFYWGGIGVLIYFIAKKIVCDERAGNRIIFSFVRSAQPANKVANDRPALVCLVCEAKNNPDFKLCWQCRAELGRCIAPDSLQVEQEKRRSFRVLLAQLLSPLNIFSKPSLYLAVLFIPSCLITRWVGEFNSHYLALPDEADFILNDVLLAAFVTSAWFFVGPKSFLRGNKHDRLDLPFGFKTVIAAFVPAIIISLFLVGVALALGMPLVVLIKKFELIETVKGLAGPVGLLSTALLMALAQGTAYRFFYGSMHDHRKPPDGGEVTP